MYTSASYIAYDLSRTVTTERDPPKAREIGGFANRGTRFVVSTGVLREVQGISPSLTPKKLEFSVDTPSELAYISPFFEGRES
jgi:hypothetical protein